MLSPDILLLMGAAASVGVIHALLGPDHYLPFAVMSRAGRWSPVKTFWVTLLCGIGHVASSVLLGIVGIMLGVAVSRLEWIEAGRGEIAAWALIAFGLIYFVWGVRRAVRSKPHAHFHAGENITPWVLFTIFVFGPCEPLIPLLMYPSARVSVSGLLMVVLVFSFFTIGTMLVMVQAISLGFSGVFSKPLERYSHALAGAVILLSGVGIRFLGL